MVGRLSKILKELNIGLQSSRWDRYLGMTAPMTQVPVPTATSKFSRGLVAGTGIWVYPSRICPRD